MNDENFRMVVDWIGLISGGLGIIGFVVSAITLYKTIGIQQAVTQQKMVSKFKSDYPSIKSAIETYIKQLETDDIQERKLFYSLHKTLLQLNNCAETSGWKKSEVDFITECCRYVGDNLEKLTNENGIIDSSTISDLIKRMHKIQIILSNEGVLNDIGSD